MNRTTTGSPVWRVALVEDEAPMRAMEAILIQRTSGLELVGAYGQGADALKLLPSAKPDLVLMDIIMPGMNGLACARRLKALLPQVQIIMVTGLSDEEALAEAQAIGTNGFLVKPFTREQLLEAIQTAQAGQFYLPEEMRARPSPPPITNVRLVLPLFLTRRALELWNSHKEETRFWLKLARNADYDAPTVSKIYGCSERQTGRDWPHMFGRSLKTWLEEAQMEFVAQGLRRGQSGPELAREFHLELTHLCRNFKRAFGLTLKQFRKKDQEGNFSDVGNWSLAWRKLVTQKTRETNNGKSEVTIYSLRKRDYQLMELLVKGLGNKAIAAELHLSVRCVESALRRLFHKLKARSRSEAILKISNLINQQDSSMNIHL